MDKRPKGQTLIELLIASAVISSGLFAAAAIVFSNLQLSDRDADEVVAINLSREGIELTKEKRDANWLGGEAFDEGLSAGGNDYTAVPEWDGFSSESVSFDFTPQQIEDESAMVYQSASENTPGFYTQSDSSATPTPWRRMLTFHPICDTAGGLTIKNDGETCGADPKIGIRVESHIQWQRKGQEFNRTLYEDLFDWR